MFTVQRFNIHIRMKFTYRPPNRHRVPNLTTLLPISFIFFAVPSYGWCHIWRSCRGVVNWPIWSQGDNTTLRSPLWAWMASYWLGKESRYVVRWSHYHRLGARSDLTCCSGKILGSFSIDDGDGSEEVTFKMNSRFFKLHQLSLFQFTENVKCRRISVELIS